MKAIIIEGMDGTGKTTLGIKLSEKYNIPYHRYTKYNISRRSEQNDLIRKGDCIMDRCQLISEWVYGNKSIEKEIEENIDILLDSNIIYLNTPNSIVLRRLKTRGDPILSIGFSTKNEEILDIIKKTKKKYEELFSKYNIKTVSIPDIERMIKNDFNL